MTLDHQGDLMPADHLSNEKPTVYTIGFAFERPPLRSNDRLGKVLRKQLTEHVVTTTIWHARRLPYIPGPVTVALTWNVNDRIRRNPLLMLPTLEAMVTGLIAADVLEPDPPEPPELRLDIHAYDKATLPTPFLNLSVWRDAS